jgi:hypothetical protein
MSGDQQQDRVPSFRVFRVCRGLFRGLFRGPFRGLFRFLIMGHSASKQDSWSVLFRDTVADSSLSFPKSSIP